MSSVNKSEKNYRNKKTDKRFENLKLLSVGSCLLLIGILLVLNILLDTLFGDKLTYDFSSTSQNSVSKQALSYIDALPEDTQVRIVGLFDRPDSLSGKTVYDDGRVKNTAYYEYIIPLLDDMCSKSSGKITIEYINPKKYPSIIAELDPSGLYDLEADIFVVKAGNSIRTINPVMDCFTYDNNYISMGYYFTQSNITESAFINAILSVTGDEHYNAYFVTELGGSTHNEFSVVLSTLFFDSFDLPMSDNFTIPEDCDLLIISNPTNDITEQAAVALTQYVSMGGKVMVSVDVNNSNITESYENLNSFLSSVSINVTTQVIADYATDYQLDNNPYTSLADIGSDFTGYYDGKVRIESARYVREFSVGNNEAYVYPLLFTSENASVYDSVISGNSEDSIFKGQYTAGLLSLLNNGNNGMVMCLGTDTFIGDDYISTYGYNDGNIIFIRGFLRDLYSIQNSADISPKSMANYNISAEKYTAASSSAVALIFVILVPMFFVVLSFVVYRKRKNL